MLIDRLLAKIAVDNDGCWIWAATKDRDGYGKILNDGKVHSAHRVSYELHRGKIPTGICVCHHCDNRACVNPDHLFLGSHAENMADMKAKARQARGMNNARSKLSETDILDIRAAKGVAQRKLAQSFGICQAHISEIQTGKKWSHI